MLDPEQELLVHHHSKNDISVIIHSGQSVFFIFLTLGLVLGLA